eukprot:XP_025013838.1 HIPL1 protein [Ricinus communis]
MNFAFGALFLFYAALISFNPQPSTLKDQWRSRENSCKAFGGSSNGTACFSGEPVSFNITETLQPEEGLCLERLENRAYLNMVPHPDGSDRVFLANQQGVVWLVTVPDEDSNKILELDESKPFLNISNQVVHDTETGLMGMAFHPNFARNGRLFLSFNCDKTKQLECSGRCSCNTDVNCDPSKLSSDSGVWPCQYHSVIAEFSANSTALETSFERSADPSEVRRIFTIGLPSKSGHAGQILFGPTDGYLYVMMGDGSRQDDPYNFSQNKKSLLGKIMRLDIDHIPSATEIHHRGFWGNYSIPRDNPYTDDKELAPEIWALGFRNPWRCSFDSERASYFLCGDCGQDQYEEVDKVIKGGNYGWHVYEGPFLLHPASSPEGNASTSSINSIFPVMGYSHDETHKLIGSASITGGYFYRSTTDPCLYGRYLYMDLYAGVIWAGTENPENSGNFITTKISYRCAHESPIQCSFAEGNSLPEIGYVFSLAEDNKKDIYVLTSTGVYRIARPSRCNYTCSKEIRAASVISRTHSSSVISGHLSKRCRALSLFLISFISFMLLVIL